MKTQMNKSETVKYFTVPGDVLIDILFILHHNNIGYETRQVNRQDNNVLIALTGNSQPTNYQPAVRNISAILKDYNYYVNGVPGEGMMTEPD